jgi:S1-C subfamily serine protease
LPSIVALAPVVLLATLVAAPSYAQRATPAEATVLVRLIGHVRVLRGEDERAWRERLLNLQEVEIGTGSGFIISPEGWVVTNHHVITGEKSTIIVHGRKLEVTIEVSAIEVLLPPRAGGAAQRLRATVYAEDPDLDLAILRVDGSDLPYAAIGDSDAMSSGEAVAAVGYPYGGALDIDKPKTADAVPSPSIANGALSATRVGTDGDARFLQVSTALHPGNSGGPIADAEGYVVGVAQLRLRDAEDIGFAVPINRVKQFLQKHGIEAALPVTLLAPGGHLASGAKGIDMPMPLGFADHSPTRLRVDATSTARTSRVTDPGNESLSLRVDRILTNQTLQQLEHAMLSDGAFERFQRKSTAPLTRPPVASTRRTLSGHTTGIDPASGRDMKIVYTLIDLGKEMLVARYIGAADTIAANRSLLHGSLRSLEATALLTNEVSRPLDMLPSESRHALSATVSVPVPRGWIVESGRPWLCAPALGAPTAALTISPAGDFSVALRAAWFPGASAEAPAASRTCAAPGAFGDASYTARAAAWGVDYRLDGVFVPARQDGLWQLEVIAPTGKSALVSQLFAKWVAADRTMTFRGSRRDAAGAPGATASRHARSTGRLQRRTDPYPAW